MESKLLQTAIENLQKGGEIIAKQLKDHPLDGTIELQVNSHLIELVVFVKNEIRPQNYPQIAETFKNNRNLILVANKIYPKVKELLRAERMAYLETVGNIFLNHEDVYIWLEHEKAHNPEKNIRNKAFTKSGLRVVYQFLTYPKILNEPYRTIADKAGVALGNIPAIFDSLKNDGFLLRKDKHRFLLDRKKDLLNKWVDAYGAKLKPSLKIGEFGLKNGQELSSLKLDAIDSVYGGEVAGEFFTKYLRPERGTIYTRLGKAKLIQKYGLIPQKNGPIEIFQMFWENLEIEDPELNEKLPFSTPILTYADLIQTGDKRCIDTAKMIYDERIQSEL